MKAEVISKSQIRSYIQDVEYVAIPQNEGLPHNLKPNDLDKINLSTMDSLTIVGDSTFTIKTGDIESLQFFNDKDSTATC